MKPVKRIFNLFLTAAFLLTGILPINTLRALENAPLVLPVPGSMIGLSAKTQPVLLKGLKIHPENPLLIDFIIDNSAQRVEGQSQEEAGLSLVKYFLASLTIPENEQWVNLSPYEHDRIIPTSLGSTEMGRDLLAEDYLLKQLTASLIFPQKEIGKKFWDTVYLKAKEKYKSANISVDTFNKVWVVADKVKLYAKNNAVMIVDSHLKVMLDQDYVAKKKHGVVASENIGQQIIRDIVIPELENEINTGAHFAMVS